MISHQEIRSIKECQVQNDFLYVLCKTSMNKTDSMFVMTLEACMIANIALFNQFDTFTVSTKYLVLINNEICSIYSLYSSPRYTRLYEWVVSRFRGNQIRLYDDWLYICDSFEHCIRIYSVRGQNILKFSDPLIRRPAALCVTSQFIYIAHLNGLTVIDKDFQVLQKCSYSLSSYPLYSLEVSDSSLYFHQQHVNSSDKYVHQILCFNLSKK